MGQTGVAMDQLQWWRFFTKFCKVRNGTFDTNCKGFNLLPTQDRYIQIIWEDWKKFFHEGDATEVKKETEKSHFIHLWNKHSYEEIAKAGSKAAIRIRDFSIFDLNDLESIIN